MLYGEVGGTGGCESPGGELDIWKFPVQPQACACARDQPRLGHELLRNTWAANIDHGPCIVEFCLGSLAEHSEQRIGFHPALIAPEAQADLATRTDNAAGLT